MMKISENVENPLDATDKKLLKNLRDKEYNIIMLRNSLIIRTAQMIVNNFNEPFLSFKFGEGNDLSVRLIGNPNQPTIVFKDNDNNFYTLSIFVKNFKMFFSNSFGSGNILAMFDVNTIKYDDGIEELKHFLANDFKDVQKCKVNVLQHENGMYFSHFDSYGHVFWSETNPRLFFDTKMSEVYNEKLTSMGFNTKIG